MHGQIRSSGLSGWYNYCQLLGPTETLDRAEDIASVQDNHANVAISILLALYDSERPGTCIAQT